MCEPPARYTGGAEQLEVSDAARTLADYPDIPAEERASFTAVLAHESAALGERLHTLATDFRDLATVRWPMADVHSADLLNCVIAGMERDR